MRSVIFASLAAFGLLSGCARPQSYDVMRGSVTCDSVPPPLARGERAGGELPSGISPITGSGVLIGVVLQARTGRPLQPASVWLHKPGSKLVSTTDGHAVSNVAGGFTVRSMQPGTYTMRITLIGHSPRERTVTVRPGAIDTIRTELTYMNCIGY
jgi:hypothetical protein